jgi:hypothetical protein
MLKPEHCPNCGKEGDIIDDDGQTKYYSCERCNLTWRQNGVRGNPILSSIDSDNPQKHYNALIKAGWSSQRAENAVRKANKGVDRTIRKQMGGIVKKYK